MKSFKPRVRHLLLIAPALLAGVAPDLALSTHALAAPVAGQITAAPSSGEVEVDHHAYRIKLHSSAETTAPTLSVGQKVSLILDGPANDSRSSVIGIEVAQGS